MTIVYLIFTVLFATAFVVDIFLRFVENIGNFGLDKEFFRFKSDTIPIQDFLPHNVTFVCLFFLSFGVCGLFCEGIGTGWFSVPCALVFAASVNFVGVHFVIPRFERLKGKKPPESDELTGKRAVCTLSIPADGYGKAQLTENGITVEKNAVSVNGTDIETGESVLLVHEEEEVWFVEKDSEVLDVLNEK